MDLKVKTIYEVDGEEKTRTTTYSDISFSEIADTLEYEIGTVEVNEHRVDVTKDVKIKNVKASWN